MSCLIHLAQFIEGDLQRIHLAEELGEFFGEEGALALLGDAAHGTLGHEVAEATLVVDDFERLQVVEGAHHGVGIHLHHRGILAHRGDAVVFAIPTLQYLVADALGYLQVYGVVVLEVHATSFLWHSLFILNLSAFRQGGIVYKAI